MVKAYNKDIMDWGKFPEYDIMCTDPPWEQKALSMFQTMLKKDTGVIKKHTIAEILTQLAKLSNTRKPCVIAYSEKGSELLIEIMVSYGHTHNGSYLRMQSMGRPHLIIVFNDFSNIIKVPNAKGLDIVTEMLQAIPYVGIVFDAFAGIGKTAEATQKAGWQYVGSEINANRYARLVKAIK
jgi:hypothetical protein